MKGDNDQKQKVELKPDEISTKTRKILAVVIVAVAVVIVLVVVDYVRPESFIRTMFLRFQSDELNDDIEAQEMLDKLIIEDENPASNIVVLNGTFDRLEGDKIYFRARESVETDEGVFINFIDQVGVITKDTEIFRMILSAEEEVGTKNFPIEASDISKSEEIIVRALKGSLPVGEVLVQTLYVSY